MAYAIIGMVFVLAILGVWFTILWLAFTSPIFLSIIIGRRIKKHRDKTDKQNEDK